METYYGGVLSKGFQKQRKGVSAKMKLCKHQDHTVIDWVLDPKWSTKEILLDVEKITKEHNIIQFKNESAKNKYGWFYMSGKMIRRHHTQKNGAGQMYVVPLSKRQSFEPNKRCEHLI